VLVRCARYAMVGVAPAVGAAHALLRCACCATAPTLGVPRACTAARHRRCPLIKRSGGKTREGGTVYARAVSQLLAARAVCPRLASGYADIFRTLTVPCQKAVRSWLVSVVQGAICTEGCAPADGLPGRSKIHYTGPRYWSRETVDIRVATISRPRTGWPTANSI
jgi:hypothetical protein